ncbi:hypothetical protein Misp01_55120 [Microtetraspora sp. NBRC 13810]|uniref:hypothetical protein n=1 Tax=Microtetraspora sp. NBRC 13810 TaxID=3030990 RepID=UPI0024A312BE|nr:hypothetical protein [Microtetraspora sp. NBRC 13810]GLW10384.1 hypothetical protein Misp01_55120 [Microtetraspora sp. NBRC 13810]
MGVREALSGVLTRAEDLAMLRENPAALRRRYGLTEAELAMLAGAPLTGFHVTRQNVRRKLARKITSYLPATVAELEASHPALLAGFLAATVRRPQPGEGVTGSWEAERLVAWIDGRVSASLSDFARYELARVSLTTDRRAAGAARAARDTGPPDTGAGGAGRLRVSAAVRVAVFDHDVTVGGPPGLLPLRYTSVLLKRGWGTPAVRAFRVGEGTVSLLARCDGSRDAAQVVAAAGGDRGQTAAMLDRLIAARVVLATTGEEDRCESVRSSNTHPSRVG